MEKTLVPGKTYTVTTASECAVTDSNGLVLCTATAGEQKAFVATTPTIIFSDDSASVVAVFKGAPALGSSGGSGGGAGTPGTPAGFGAVTATATSLAAGSTPTASVETSGFNTAKNFAFSFGIPQGEKGEKGDKGDTGATGTVDTSILEDYATISYVDEAIAAGGGGASITFDSVPTADSTNAVTSGGVYTVAVLHSSLGENSLAVGTGAVSQNASAVVIGDGAMTGAYYNSSGEIVVVSTDKTTLYDSDQGRNSNCGSGSVVVGNKCVSYGPNNIVIGRNCAASKSASIVIGYGCSATVFASSIVIGRNASGGNHGVSIGVLTVANGASVALGLRARSSGSNGVTIGSEASASNDSAVAAGYYAKGAGVRAVACGSYSEAQTDYSAAFGSGVKNGDNGATVIGAWNNDGTTQTLLYLIGAGSTLATTYEDGEACMGYVVKDTSGNVSACGTQKLSALFPNNTAWATMALGLDDETPTPFLPTGATDPIEFPETEELTEE